MKSKYASAVIAGVLACILFGGLVLRAQPAPAMSKSDQEMIAVMLREARDEVRKHYYDPSLHGLDWDARYKQYADSIGKARNLGEGYRVVAAFLEGLKDSHTFFMPPWSPIHLDYGFRYALVGDTCYITQLRPGSDAASKLHIGDQVVKMSGFTVNRDDFHDVHYYFNILALQTGVGFDLLSPAGEASHVFVNTKVVSRKLILDLNNAIDLWEFKHIGEEEVLAAQSRIAERGDIAIWKLKEFNLNSDQVERAFGIARKHKTLILDLRGNPGGEVATLKSIVAGLFDHDVKISDRAGRKENKPVIAKHGGRPFEGKLIVLVDAGCASGSELLARVVQLEHRGTVIGDKTAAKVMEAQFYRETQGSDAKIYYGFSVTEANLIMSDGQNLEKTGVTPDELLLPTAADLAAGRDPVLAHAAELGGVQLDPEAAGKLFPYEWQPL
ncbi:MAG: S41 family peptidase [Terracidiphilus sp.]|jgi:carboxyl-terminal processing protease